MTGMRGGIEAGEPLTRFEVANHVVLQESSSAACAVASYDGWLHLAWTGSDSRLNVMLSADGVTFGQKSTLGHRSSRTEGAAENSRTVPLAPALTTTGGGVHLGWTGTDRRLNILQLWAPEDQNVVIPERSSHGPALVAAGSELLLGWTGGDRRLNVIRAHQGRFGPPLTLDHTSRKAPALAAWGEQQLLAWAGGDDQLNLLELATAPYSQPTFPGRTDRTPALCSVGDDLVVAWRDADRRLNVRVARGRSWGPAVPLPSTSSHGPAVCCHRNNLVMAWTGTDRRLNVGLLRPSM